MHLTAEMASGRKRIKYSTSDDESDQAIERKPAAKWMTINRSSRATLPILNLGLDSWQQIRNFFGSPVPNLFNHDKCAFLEIELRRLVGADGSSVADTVFGVEMEAFIEKYDLQLTFSPFHPDYQLLELDDEDDLDEQEMARLADLGIAAVMRPWGRLADVMGLEWSSQPMRNLYDSKTYVDAGIYATRPGTGAERFSDFGFKFSFPVEQGDLLISQERDFLLSWEMAVYYDTTGADEWLGNRSSTGPSPFQYIKKSIHNLT